MQARRLQEVGGGTLLVSLPKDWTRRHALRKGSLVGIWEQEDGSLLLKPLQGGVEEGIKEVKIGYRPRELPRMANEIIGAYLLGFELISVVGDERILYEDREGMKRAIRQLIGLEIVEEDAYSLVAQFLLEESNLEPEKVLKRMHSLVRGMHKDALLALGEGDEHLAKMVVERDDEVDRLYFLLVRILRSAAMDSSLANKLGLKRIDCLDYRVAANLLEAMGDAATELALGALEVNGALNKGVLQSLSSALEALQERAISIFLKRRSGEAQVVLELYHRLQKRLEELEALAKGGEGKGMRRILEAMARLGRCCVDIADLAVPLYPLLR